MSGGLLGLGVGVGASWSEGVVSGLKVCGIAASVQGFATDGSRRTWMERRLLIDS